MPGFVFLSRKVELLGAKIIEFFLRNALPVLNFSKDETFLKENWSNRQRKKFTVNTIPLQTYSIFFFALYKLTWDVASSFPFSLKGERKRFLFYDQSFFVISPIKSIPFHSTSFPFFFFALYKLTWDVASSFPFSLKGERKRFLFYDQSFFVISPIKSIPFHSTSFHGITCGRGSFAVHFGDHLWLGIICGTVQYWLHCWISFIAETPGQRAFSFAHAQSGSMIWRPFWKCPTVSNLLLWKFGDRSYIMLLDSITGHLKVVTNYNGTISL